MTSLEDRIHAATHALAETVPASSIAPLQLPPPTRQRSRLRPIAGIPRRGRMPAQWTRRLAPVAAAAAVVAVGVAVVVVGKSTTGTSGAGQATTEGAGPAVTALIAAGTIPAYYVSVTGANGAGISQQVVPSTPADVVVRSTVTGATLGRVTPPKNGTFLAVTSAADDRTFVLDEQPWSSSNNSAFVATHNFYLLRLGRNGQPGNLVDLHITIPNGDEVDGVALSPHGDKLAIAYIPNTTSATFTTTISMYTLATGAVRSWSGPGAVGGARLQPDTAETISWTNDEQALAYNWVQDGGKASCAPADGVQGPVCMMLLNIGLPGSNLVDNSRDLYSYLPDPYPFLPLSPAEITSSSSSGSVSASLPPPGSTGSSGSASATALAPDGTGSSGSASASVSASGYSSAAGSGSASLPPPNSTATTGPTSEATGTVTASPKAAPLSTALDCPYFTVLTPDGSAVVCGEIKVSSVKGGTATVQTSFVEHPTSPGQPTRSLGHWTVNLKKSQSLTLPVGVLWSDSSGSTLIGAIPTGAHSYIVGVISGNKFTALPAGTPIDAVW